MVVGVVIRELIRLGGYAVKGYKKYNKYEAQAFSRAWRGYPKGVRLGTRHGFVGGSVVGSVAADLSNGYDDTPVTEVGKVLKRPQQKTYKQRKEYFRDFRKSNRRYCKPKRYSQYR